MPLSGTLEHGYLAPLDFHQTQAASYNQVRNKQFKLEYHYVPHAHVGIRKLLGKRCLGPTACRAGCDGPSADQLHICLPRTVHVGVCMRRIVLFPGGGGCFDAQRPLHEAGGARSL